MMKPHGLGRAARDLCRQAGDTLSKGSAAQILELCSAPALELQRFCCISLSSAWLQRERSFLHTPGFLWMQEG